MCQNTHMTTLPSFVSRRGKPVLRCAGVALCLLLCATPLRFDAALGLTEAVAMAKDGRDGGRDRDDRRDDRNDRRDDRRDDREDRRDDRRDEREDRRDDLRDQIEDRLKDLEDQAKRSGGAVLSLKNANGELEAVARGIYQRFDASGRLIEQRRATGADLVRMRAQTNGRATVSGAGSAVQGRGDAPVQIRIGGNDITVTYRNGWVEQVVGGRFRMQDRYGNLAVERPATKQDRDRLRSLAGR